MTAKVDSVSRMKAVFYRDPEGGEPVRRWLDTLVGGMRKSVLRDIASTELGWPDRCPPVEAHGGGLFSIVTFVGDGTSSKRTYFFVEESSMLLLYGADHGTAGLDNARRHLSDHRSRTRS